MRYLKRFPPARSSCMFPAMDKKFTNCNSRDREITYLTSIYNTKPVKGYITNRNECGSSQHIHVLSGSFVCVLQPYVVPQVDTPSISLDSLLFHTNIKHNTHTHTHIQRKRGTTMVLEVYSVVVVPPFFTQYELCRGCDVDVMLINGN